MEKDSNFVKFEVTDGSLSSKLNELLKELDDDNELSSGFSIKEEMVEEVMQELYREIMYPNNLATLPANFLLSSPSSSLSSTSSQFTPVATNDGTGRDSCVMSVSIPASTVMTGIEYVGTMVKMGWPNNGCKGVAEEGGFNYEVGACEGFGENQLDDCDGGELDDEWLERLLNWDPPQLDEEHWF
ncbi:hypothetical protein CJ030_MR3G009455 [Morella rubra]|uniref:Uncharacterized protein n=1 Tax=Morella rubra TaxID=262757 RepID=A0A6A1W4H4_9ROSI|nr:hypothetical protein CJ030_MR3G009455 [Morella rubra]